MALLGRKMRQYFAGDYSKIVWLYSKANELKAVLKANDGTITVLINKYNIYYILFFRCIFHIILSIPCMLYL